MHADMSLRSTANMQFSRYEQHYKDYTKISGQMVQHENGNECINVWRTLVDEDSKSMPVLELRRLKFVI